MRGQRKLWISASAMALASVALALGWIDGEQWSLVVGTAATGFALGNAGEHIGDGLGSRPPRSARDMVRGDDDG